LATVAGTSKKTDAAAYLLARPAAGLDHGMRTKRTATARSASAIFSEPGIGEIFFNAGYSGILCRPGNVLVAFGID
jgi:hypothetical protein